jgi:hypothetical protein
LIGIKDAALTTAGAAKETIKPVSKERLDSIGNLQGLYADDLLGKPDGIVFPDDANQYRIKLRQYQLLDRHQDTGYPDDSRGSYSTKTGEEGSTGDHRNTTSEKKRITTPIIPMVARDTVTSSGRNTHIPRINCFIFHIIPTLNLGDYLLIERAG